MIVISIINISLITTKSYDYNTFIQDNYKQSILIEKTINHFYKNEEKELLQNLKEISLNNTKLISSPLFQKVENNYVEELNNFINLSKETNKEEFIKLLDSKQKLLYLINENISIIDKESAEFISFIKTLTIIVLLVIISYLVIESRLIITPLFERVKTAQLRQIRFKRKLSKSFRIKTRRIKESLEIINHYVYTSQTDANGVITYVSDAFCELSGYKKEELLGKTHNIIKHPDTKEEVFKELWKTIKNGNIYVGELKNLTKNKKEFWVKSYIRPQFDQKGNICGYIAYRKDISHEKVLEKVNSELEEKIAEKTKILQEQNELLTKLSITDPLTKLYNRNKLKEEMNIFIQRAKRYDEIFSIIILDIDHFKKVNDEHGHLKGDKVLIAISNILKDNLRNVDLVARWGGEEFIILVDKQKLEEAIFIAQKLRKVIEKQLVEDLRVTASLGVSQFNKDDTSETLFKRADEALYEAKQTGRNRVCFKN
ncbi:diguanylate cyclase [Arcobacter sp. YIC-464]|uniref:sensor domain-containing diguanylate cyclase n=1 Tax=Arcobacter sp. YIC-464 TaxID=3376631 RepID=UPI003C19A415